MSKKVKLGRPPKPPEEKAEDTRPVTVHVPKSLYAALEARAVSEDVSVSHHVRRLIRRDVQENSA